MRAETAVALEFEIDAYAGDASRGANKVNAVAIAAEVSDFGATDLECIDVE